MYVKSLINQLVPAEKTDFPGVSKKGYREKSGSIAWLHAFALWVGQSAAIDSTRMWAQPVCTLRALQKIMYAIGTGFKLPLL